VLRELQLIECARCYFAADSDFARTRTFSAESIMGCVPRSHPRAA
jgi:hypothetical protein